MLGGVYKAQNKLPKAGEVCLKATSVKKEMKAVGLYCSEVESLLRPSQKTGTGWVGEVLA